MTAENLTAVTIFSPVAALDTTTVTSCTDGSTVPLGQDEVLHMGYLRHSWPCAMRHVAFGDTACAAVSASFPVHDDTGWMRTSPGTGPRHGRDRTTGSHRPGIRSDRDEARRLAPATTGPHVPG